MSLCFALGIPPEGRVKCLYIEKEIIRTEWTVFLIFVITRVFRFDGLTRIRKVSGWVKITLVELTWNGHGDGR